MTRVAIPVRAVATPAAGCDCGVCPFSMSNPAAIEPVCSGSNTDCSYCGVRPFDTLTHAVVDREK